VANQSTIPQNARKLSAVGMVGPWSIGMIIPITSLHFNYYKIYIIFSCEEKYPPKGCVSDGYVDIEADFPECCELNFKCNDA